MLTARSSTLAAGSANGTRCTRSHCGVGVRPSGKLAIKTTGIHQTQSGMRAGKRLTSESDPAQLAPPKLAVQIQRLADDADGVLDAQHFLDDHLLVLERLVVLEEAADFPQRVTRNLRFVGVFGEGWIANADGDDLVVDPFLVAHAHDADGAGLR